MRHINAESSIITGEGSRRKEVHKLPKRLNKSKKGQKSNRKAREKPCAQKRVKAARPVRPVSKKVQASPVLNTSMQTPASATLTSAGGKLRVDRIDRDTVLGDLIVAFPWTREVLRKYGLCLEVEEAGDIYMSLEAFAALRNLKPDSLVRELVDASKQPPQPVAPLVATLVT